VDEAAQIYLEKYHSTYYKGDLELEKYLEHELPIMKDQIIRGILLYACWLPLVILSITPPEEKSALMNREFLKQGI
jgi:hypothetical protein